MPSGFNLGTAYATIEIDSSGIASGMDAAKKSVSGGLNDISDSMTSLGSNMTLLGAPFLAFGAMAVKSFTDSEDALAQLDAVLKSTTAHNGEWSTTTAASAEDLEKLSEKLEVANDRLFDMQSIYDSTTDHTISQTIALDNQKKKVADLSAALAAGNTQITTMTNVTHMSRQALIDMASGLESVTRFSDETILSAESMLLTFTNIGEKVFPDATRTVLDMSQALGQDTKSSAIQLGKALNDPIKGITALQRVGVAFTESQKAMITQLVKAGKVEEAQKIILKELQVEFGGSAVAAGQTFAGQLERARNQIDNVMEGIGEKLIPVVTELVNHIIDVVNWFALLDPQLQTIIIGVGVFMAALAVIGPIIAAVGVGLGSVVAVISSLGAILGVVLVPLGVLAAAVGLLYVAFQNNFLGIRDFLKPIFDSITAFFANFQNNVKLYGSLILLYAQYYFQGVVTAIQDIINKISDFIAKNPEFAAAMLLLGAVVLGAAIVAGVLPIVLGAISFAIGLVTGAIGILLTPALLLVLAIGAIIYAASKLYPGGLQALFNDAATAARNLAFLGMYVLASAAAWAERKIAELLDTLSRAKGALDALGGIGNLLTTGQISPQQLFDAIGAEISNNGGQGGATGANAYNAVAGKIGKAGGGGVFAGIPYTVGERGAETFVPSVNGSIIPAGAGGGGMVVNVQGIYANTEAGGRAAARGFAEELEDLFRGRGNQ